MTIHEQTFQRHLQKQSRYSYALTGINAIDTAG